MAPGKRGGILQQESALALNSRASLTEKNKTRKVSRKKESHEQPDLS